MNSESKFTPGPWYIERKLIIGPRIESDDQSNGLIYEVCDCSYSIGDKEANANLIAAAPDLYYALSSVMNEIGSCLADETYYFGTTKPFDLARAALAKARGGS